MAAILRHWLVWSLPIGAVLWLALIRLALDVAAAVAG